MNYVFSFFQDPNSEIIELLPNKLYPDFSKILTLKFSTYFQIVSSFF